jgi:hypothetical protein
VGLGCATAVICLGLLCAYGTLTMAVSPVGWGRAYLSARDYAGPRLAEDVPWFWEVVRRGER